MFNGYRLSVSVLERILEIKYTAMQMKLTLFNLC